VSADERPDLDQELRRLFSDDRLSVPVAEGAAGAVVAGARRRRRHRMALAAAGGVLAVTGLVFAGVGLTGIGRPATGPVTAAGPVLSATLTATSAPPAPTQAQADDVLGPYGAEGLRLGMTSVEARKRGVPIMSNGSSKFEKCQTITMMAPSVPAISPGSTNSAPVAVLKTTTVSPTVTANRPPVAQSGTTTVDRPIPVSVVTSLQNGLVVQIGGATSLRTPEGLGVGSSVKAIVQVYRNVVRPYNGKEIVVVVPQNPSANYLFVLDRAGNADMVWLVEGKYLSCAG
jgi:hypothetical protein